MTPDGDVTSGSAGQGTPSGDGGPACRAPARWRGGETADKGGTEGRPGGERPPRRNVRARCSAAVDPGVPSTKEGTGWPSQSGDGSGGGPVRSGGAPATQGYHLARGWTGRPGEG